MNYRIGATIVCVFVLSLATISSAYGQEYDPVPGGELLDQLRSPLFLATTANTASTESVSGDVINPAASALKQRVHLDASYLTLVGDGSWDGHAGNLGVSVPTPAGVFTGSLNLASVDYATVDLGQRASLNVSFAKDLYPSLLFGAGLRGHAGANGGNTAFAGGLDLGIIHIVGPVWSLPEIRWGFAVTQLGVGLSPVEDTTGSPAPFTPAADIQATFVETETVDWTVHTGFTAPSFQNVRYRVGSQLTLFDRLGLNVGWDVDLLEQTDSDREAGSLMPSVGISFRFQTDIASEDGIISEQGWNRSDLAIHSAWAPLTDDVWAAGAGVQAALGVIDRNPPEIAIDYADTLYISPNNDGAADEFLLPVAIEDERFIDSWTLDILDGEGGLVRRIENKEQRPENVGFQNIVDRLLYVRRGIEVPETIRWDGRTEDGGLAGDGEYTFVLNARDDNGNLRETDVFRIVVDSTPPEATISEPQNPDDIIFSPNGDGNKDTLRIAQESSPEDEWRMEILDTTDTVVYQETVTGSQLAEFEWDGRDSAGSLVPDGVYSYRASATDRALNEGSASLANIIVDTEPTPIGLTLNLGHFSPNGDGRQDAITFTPDVPVTEGIRAYRFVVLDENGDTRRTATGATDVPGPWVFDGRTESGARMNEGRYRVRLEIEYRNGNRPEALSPPFVLDVTPPRLTVRAETPIFSPNGDGRLDTVAFVQETEEIPVWTARIESEAGEIVRQYDWAGRPDGRLVWDGRTADGARAPDGPYRYVLSGTDRAGNARSGSPVEVELDTRETPVFVSSEREAFSPNDDGVVDSIDLITELADARGVERFELAILDGADRTVARITDSGTPGERYEWDGRGATGRVVADGTYRVRIEVEYRHGNRPSATSAPFRVDTVAPRARVELADTIFSPDGDGRRDAVTIRQESSREALWTAEIVPDDGGPPVRRWSFSGELAPLEWDGTDEDGAVVEDGRYRYRVTSVDGAGNRFSTTTSPFRTDTREVDVQLRISEAAFSPNGDGVLDAVELIPGVNIESPIAEWILSVEDTTGDETIFETSGIGELETVTWRGEGRTGRAPDGFYRGRLRVRFARGDEVEIVSARGVVLDTVAPAADVALSSPVISPNGDGTLDELVVSQTTSEEERWIARVLDDTDGTIGRWEWVGRAEAELAFAGLDDERRRVPDGMYAYILQATDRAGNSSSIGPLPFEIYTAETPLELYPSRSAFSPNGDGAFDTLDFRIVAGEARGLERYTFVVETSSGEDVMRTTGVALPERFSWNGRTQGGGRAEEGRYRATLEVEYRHGNRPAASTTAFLLDTTPPALELAASHEIFSPDGDGRRDTVSVRQSSDAAEGWRGRITAESGEVIREYGWTDRTAAFEWDGTDIAGNVVADGRYRYTVEGTDAAGNTARGELAAIEVDTRTARIFVTLDRRTISPNGDGVDDRLEIGMIASRQDGAEYRLVEIVDESGTVVETFRSEAVELRETLVWDGLIDGVPIADGRYAVRFSVGFRNGALPRVSSPELVVDTAGPELAVNLAGLPFSPDNDGLNDELGIGLTTADASDIAEWSFEILDRTNAPFQQFDGSARPRSELVWDGRSNDGELVISAEDYPYRFSAVDTTGNRSEVTGTIPIDILVVRDGDLLRIQISNINFEPNSPELQLDPATEQGAKNISVLDRLVEVFDKYRTYEIRVEGHAVNLSGTAEEEREELEPLSTARADTVRDALVERGMDIERISVEGRGGTAPIVPHTDRENRWKNRRVEFILIR